MKLKIKKVIVILIIFITQVPINIKAENLDAGSIAESVGQEYKLDSYIETIDEFVDKDSTLDIDLSQISKALFSGNKLDYGGFFEKFIALFFKEVVITARGAIAIFIIVIIMAIISSLELEKKSDITKIAHMACFLVLSTIAISSFINIIGTFKEVVNLLTVLMQTISPFIMGVLMATGAVTTTGMLQPMLLFLASFIGFIVNYVVIPFITLSLAINVICAISPNINLGKAGGFFNSAAIWIVGICLTLFLGVLSLESSLTSSVDSLAVKTTQAAVSNFVPVVGKFFSDSFETVVGATKVIGKVGGTIGIIGIILVAAVPLIKIGSTVIIYYLLNVVIEPIYPDETISKFLTGLYGVYKTLFGILVGIVILFVISTGIILNLSNAVIK